MQNRKFRKWNNTGSTLVMVLVCMLFVGIIASLVLTLTMRNVENTATISDASGNFYTGENVIDEVQANLEQIADRAAREAYVQWLQTINLMSVEEQKTAFKQLFAERFVTLVENEFLSKFTAGTQDDLLVKFDSSNVKWGGTIPTVRNNGDGTVSVCGVSIEYLDNTGGAARISTDLVFSLDNPGFQMNMISGTNVKCAEYVIIADSQISAMETTGGIIQGSLYGGGIDTDTGKYTKDGIVLGNMSSLAINADKLLTRTGIRLGGSSNTSVTIKGYDSKFDFTGTLHYCDIWARNIDLEGGASTDTKLQVQGNCYVADDLTLESERSSFGLTGQYYGYSASSINSTPAGSSAIVVNGKNSKLDLKKASTVWIAGKSFISVPSQWGVKSSTDSVAFMQGESIAYRGTQAAYLLPGDCIPSIGHNPMTSDEYRSLFSEFNANGTPKESSLKNDAIDISVSRKKGGVRLEDYVNRSKPYRSVSVLYNASTSMVYLYLNFQSADKAAAYFAAYEQTYDDLVQNRMAMLENGTIEFDPASLVSTGNVVGYSANTVAFSGRTDNYNSIRVEDMQLELESKYAGLVTSLDESYSGADINSGRLTETLVDYSKVADRNIAYAVENMELPESITEESKLQVGDYKLITGKDITIEKSMNAIVIASGNVTIKGGAKITGLIIAKGNVTLLGGANLYSDKYHVSYLINNDKNVRPYFIIGDQVQGDDKEIFTSDLLHVSYDNWKKN